MLTKSEVININSNSMILSPKNFPPWPSFEDDEIEAVVGVLRSGKVNQWTGTEVTQFEKKFSEYVGVKHAIALANGSIALDLALKILKVGPGDEVIVSPRTFIASASCIALRGATPVFVDIDRDSQNISLTAVKKAWTPETRAVIAVHLAGWPCVLDELRTFCDKKGMYLIEDCAQAQGAKFKNNSVGTYGDFSVFSFCQDKIMTTGGEGGMLVTNNADLWEKAWAYKDHGKDYKTAFHQEHPPGFRWMVKSFGTNYRMTEMQAAIGRKILPKLVGWVTRRRKHAEILTEGFENISGLRVTIPSEDFFHSYYKYYVFLRLEMLKPDWSRDRILDALTQSGIPCGSGSCAEVYLEEVFQNKGRCSIVGSQNGRLPIAKELGESSMMFPVHPTLVEENLLYTVKQMKTVMKAAIK